MESRTESSNERIDRHWRRWVSFTDEWGLGSDPWLDTVPEDGERLLLGRCFVMYCRTYNFDREGRAHSERAKQMVSTSLRDAVSCVASSFRERGRPSPFHVPHGVHGGGSIHPRIRSLLAGFESKDPLPHRQKALTPALLTDIHKACRVRRFAAHFRPGTRSLFLCDEGMRVLSNRETRKDTTTESRECDVQREGRQHRRSRRSQIDRESPVRDSLLY